MNREQESEEGLKRIIEMRQRVEDITALLDGKPPPHGLPVELPECTACGRCCTAPKGVATYLVKVDPGDDVPPELMHGTAMRMRGSCRCAALTGVIDKQVKCTIYERRPSVCRGFVRGGPECLRRLVDVLMEQL